MKIITKALVAGVLVGVLAIAGVSWAAGFSPTLDFRLSSKKSDEPIGITIDVEQDRGEEELQNVELKVPAAFEIPNLSKFEGCAKPPAAQVPCNGEVLGTGLIHIMVGPGCAASPQNAAAAYKAELPAKLVVVEETADDRQGGTLGIWNLEITGVTTIPLKVSKAGGNWVIKGDIPANPGTCPEFDFSLTINQTSSASPSGTGGGRQIFVTPKVTEDTVYTFGARFESADSPKVVSLSQKVTITK
jgi:hypothetical protein